jgi:hypothetical protein
VTDAEIVEALKRVDAATAAVSDVIFADREGVKTNRYADATQALEKYADDLYRCGIERYSVVYYNVKSRTNLEFSLMPDDYFIRFNEHGVWRDNYDKPVWYQAAGVDPAHGCRSGDHCGSPFCRVAGDAQWTGTSAFFDPDKQDLPVLATHLDEPFIRWHAEAGWNAVNESKLSTFRVAYEHFLHKNYGRTEVPAELPAYELPLLKPLKAPNGRNLTRRGGILFGHAACFGAAPLDLAKYNERNDLSNFFFGWYVMPPTDERVALLLVYFRPTVCSYFDQIESSLRVSERLLPLAQKLIHLFTLISWPPLEQEIHNDLRQVFAREQDQKLQHTRAITEAVALKTHISQLIKTIGEAKQTAVIVEEQLRGARIAYLHAFDDLKLLFVPRKTVFFGKTDQGDLRLDGYAFTDAKEAKSTHFQDDATLEIWDIYKQIISIYNESRQIPLLSALELWKSPRRGFQLFKMMIQRPQVYRAVYGLQLLVTALLARDAGAAITVCVVDLTTGEISQVDGFAELEAMANPAANATAPRNWPTIWFSTEGSNVRVDLPPSAKAIQTADVLAELHTLLARDLTPSMPGDQVVLESVDVINTTSDLQLYIACKGTFPEEIIDEIQDLSSSGDHSLRGALRVLALSAGESGVLAARNVFSREELVTLSDKARRQFVAGVSEGRTSFLIRWAKPLTERRHRSGGF